MSIADTLAARSKTHGDFETNSKVAQYLKLSMHTQDEWNRLEYWQREALDMIAHKMARIIAGNSLEPDHWHDIAGYASLAESIIRRRIAAASNNVTQIGPKPAA